MLNSKELRVKAWNSLRDRYWSAFAATIVVSLLASIPSAVATLASKVAGINTAALKDGIKLDSAMMTEMLKVSGAALLIAAAALVISAFVQSPATIGECNYYRKNTASKPKISEVFAGFKAGYGRNVKVMFFMGIKVVLWSLLLVIPGIIKAFEYALIPYILADDPDISSKDAFKKSKELMSGNKWRLFKLNFSFIGWILLSILTLGIGVLFLIPYMNAANAEFYVELKDKQ